MVNEDASQKEVERNFHYIAMERQEGEEKGSIGGEESDPQSLHDTGDVE